MQDQKKRKVNTTDEEEKEKKICEEDGYGWREEDK